jgi:hypothetical protein
VSPIWSNWTKKKLKEMSSFAASSPTLRWRNSQKKSQASMMAFPYTLNTLIDRNFNLVSSLLSRSNEYGCAGQALESNMEVKRSGGIGSGGLPPSNMEARIHLFWRLSCVHIHWNGKHTVPRVNLHHQIPLTPE